MSFGQRLKQIREENGLSQSSLAKLIKVMKQSVVLWENDRAMPPSDKISEIATLFGISVDELLKQETSSETQTPFASVEVTCDENKIYRTLKSEKYLLYVGILVLAFAFMALALLLHVKSLIIFSKNQFSLDSVLAGFSVIKCLFACVICVIISLITYKKLKKRAKILSNLQSGKSTLIFVFDDRYEIIENCSGIETVTTFMNTELCSLKELESCYIFNFRYNKVFVADKSTLVGDGARMTQQAALIGRFKYSSIISPESGCDVDSRKAYQIKMISGVLLVLSFVSLMFVGALPSIFLSAGQTVNALVGFEKIFSQISPYCAIVLPLISLIFGAINFRKGMRTKNNMLAGIALIVIIFLFATMIAIGWLHLKG